MARPPLRSPRPATARALALALATSSLALAGAAAAAADEELPRLDAIHAERGFIDDPVALSPDGRSLAYVTTDGATRSELHIVTLSPHADTALPYDSITPERLAFLDDERVLAVDRDTNTRLARARVYSRRGPGRDRLGPAEQITLATVGGTPAVVVMTRTEKGGALAYAFAAYRADTLKPLARGGFTDQGARIALPGGDTRPLYFRDDYTVLVGTRSGGYDKQRDVRRPDVEVRVDVFTGKTIATQEIADLVTWTRLVDIRKKHEGQRAFLSFSEDLRHLELVNADDRRLEVRLPRPLPRYDTTTLAFQPEDEHHLLFSLTIDPVNAEAVAAKKADKDWVDLYRLDLGDASVTPLARIDGKRRPSGWVIRAGEIALLRKHKGFARGGTDLEVLALPAAARLAPAGVTPATAATPAPLPLPR